jgi:hypothetical protein
MPFRPQPWAYSGTGMQTTRLTVIAFDYRQRGGSSGQPRDVLPVSGRREGPPTLTGLVRAREAAAALFASQRRDSLPKETTHGDL